ncbi:MAG: membrane-bound lytic murein transglycosylase MltF [Gammaproteobacteria bacterium]|nr:membrane-bound lytic murein transglycosylase MltF [Gammaproteobacteria bacterium]MBU1415115.1 membrane-bound lytic murein transglycosylase MltF [Gammaproteobacteria bacterium]
MHRQHPVLKTRSYRSWAVLLIGLTLVACGKDRFEKQPDELLVGILDDPVFYQPASATGDESGFEFDLLEDFAASLNKKLRVVTARNPKKLQDLLRHRTIDFVAGLPAQQDPQLLYTTPLREARPLIVQHADTLPIYDPAAMAGRVVEVLRGTVQEVALRQLQLFPPLVITTPRATNGIELLQRVAEFNSELAATDSLHLALAVNFYPDLIVAQELPGKVELTWAFRATDEDLRTQAEAFLDGARQNGTITELRDRYFGHLKRISPIGATRFIEDIHELLPRYRKTFQEAQRLTGVDWRLLAALSYQESKWDPLATSYTGVRGIMMLTEETADRLGVKNRLDPVESILAGARYLAELKRRLTDDVPDPDRLWLALAAYNLGMGHLNGARQFAVGMSRDPNSWYDMKKVLPLMARPEYYRRLKAGRARGGEAVILVENVRTFYDILVRFEAPLNQPLQIDLTMQ